MKNGRKSEDVQSGDAVSRRLAGGTRRCAGQEPETSFWMLRHRVTSEA